MSIDRRTFVKGVLASGSVAVAGLGPWGLVRSAEARPNGSFLRRHEVRVEIDGVPVTQLVGVDPGRTDLRLQNGPGGIEYGEVTHSGTSLSVTEGPSADALRLWFDRAQRTDGQTNAQRRDLAICIASAGGAVLRTIYAYGSLPTSLVERRGPKREALVTVTFAVGMLEIA